MIERLKSIKSVLDNSGTLSKDDKAFLKQTYLEIKGVTLTIGKCKSCWNGCKTIKNIFKQIRTLMKLSISLHYGKKNSL